MTYSLHNDSIAHINGIESDYHILKAALSHQKADTPLWFSKVQLRCTTSFKACLNSKIMTATSNVLSHI